MKKISPSFYEIQSLLKILDFPINLCFAVENTWITALMISYETPNIIDSFIWIIPNILSILIRPYLINFVLNQQKTARITQLTLICLMMILGLFGCILVGLSAYIQAFIVLKISVCTIGWTMMDFGFQMVQFFSQKFSDCINKSSQKDESQLLIVSKVSAKYQSNIWPISGFLVGYCLSIGICFAFSNRTIKKFQKKAAIIYFISSAISMLFLSYTYLKIKQSQQQQSQSVPNKQFLTKIKQFKPNYCSDIGFYMPGYYQFIRAGIQDKVLLFYHFTSLYFDDTITIYVTMWIIYCNENYGFKEGLSYPYGMIYGSFYLALYTLFCSLQFNLGKLAKKQQQNILLGSFFLIAVISLICFFTYYEPLICFLCIVVGISHSFYENQFKQTFIQENPVYQVCLQFVQRVQKIFILCPMPFITMIILGRDDIDDCMAWMGLMGAAAILLSYAHKYTKTRKQTKKAIKTNKIQ